MDQPHHGGARDRQRDYLRGLAVLLLLIVVAGAVGGLAHGAARSADLDALGAVTRVVALTVLGIGVVISIVVLVLQFTGLRRSREEGAIRRTSAVQLSRRAKLALALAALVIAAGVIAFIIFVVPHGSSGSRPVAPGLPTGPARPVPVQSDEASSGGSNTELIVAGAIVLAVLAGLGYLAYRSSRPEPPLAAADEDVDEDSLERARLGALIDDAGLALAAETTPRAAIIACYRSMEGSLAAAGVERSVADAPEELLERASRGGLVLPEAAERLTALFREARFSLHPMSEAQREQAAAALAQLRTALAAR